MNKPLPSVLTSYDFLKSAALILMIVDHVGYYFFPDDLWLRVLGRLSAPIWLFLIGYANSRDLGWKMWAGAAILIASDLVVGRAVLPLNMLVTMIVLRLVIDFLMRPVERSPNTLFLLYFLATAGTIVTFVLFDYGASALLFAMFGYAARRNGAGVFGPNRVLEIGLMAAVLHFFLQTRLFFTEFDVVQQACVGLGLLGVSAVLLRFRPALYPALTASMPAPAVWLFQFLGRYSLELYVFHLLLFKGLALWLGMQGYGLFDFRIVD